MADVGTLHFTAVVDPSRVQAVVTALDMLVSLANDYGHAWTADELVQLKAAQAALDTKNLTLGVA